MLLQRTGDSLFIIIACIIVAFTVHEFAHAFISYKLGDYTAKQDGRLTLNPMKHIDYMGFIFLLITGFGWAKPVMVNPSYYKDARKGMALVALAGPVSNIILGIIGIILHFIFRYESFFIIFFYFWMINFALCIFNLIPVPPLDGSKILGLFVKGETYEAYLKHQFIGFILLMVIIFSGVFGIIINAVVNFVWRIIYGI